MTVLVYCKYNSDCESPSGTTVCKETVTGGAKTCQTSSSCTQVCSASEFCDSANVCQDGNIVIGNGSTLSVLFKLFVPFHPIALQRMSSQLAKNCIVVVL